MIKFGKIEGKKKEQVFMHDLRMDVPAAGYQSLGSSNEVLTSVRALIKLTLKKDGFVFSIWLGILLP